MANRKTQKQNWNQNYKAKNLTTLASTILNTHIAYSNMVMCGVDGFLKKTTINASPRLVTQIVMGYFTLLPLKEIYYCIINRNTGYDWNWTYTYS